MSLMTFVGNPAASPLKPTVPSVSKRATIMAEGLKSICDGLPRLMSSEERWGVAPTPKVSADPGFVAKLENASRYPNGFFSGVTYQDVVVYTSENPTNNSDHGDVTVFRRPSGSVGVQQFINGVWKTLYNDEEAMKKFNTPATTPVPTPPLPPTSNQVLSIMVIGATTDNSLVGQTAENKTVGIVKRESGSVGVKQMLNGKWETLYTEAEAKKKFTKDVAAPKISSDQIIQCVECGEAFEVCESSFTNSGYFVCDGCK